MKVKSARLKSEHHKDLKIRNERARKGFRRFRC